MTRALLPLMLGAGIGAAAWYMRSNGGAVDDWIYANTGYSMSNWQEDLNNPARGGPYKALLAQAEQKYGIPKDMLARLAWQESRYRPEIITCKLTSGAGAEGIMQIIRRWNPGVDPCDPAAAIDYAGRKLAGLHRYYNGSWQRALQAYNWGEGNLNKYLAGEKPMPTETSNYSAQILADLSAAGEGVA